MKKIKFITLSMLFTATALFAQEEATTEAAAPAGLTISGSVDAYVQTYLTADDQYSPSFGSSFADETGFALGMANAIISYEGAKTGVVADLAFGPRAISAVTVDASSLAVNQAYVYWNVSEGTTLSFGAMNTFLGYEVISPTANFNYSTSYLFSNGPFSYLGLKADFTLSDDMSLAVIGSNVTDRFSTGFYVDEDDNDATNDGEYALGLQFGAYGQFFNVYYDSGVNLGLVLDYTGGFDVSDEFYLGINAAYQTAEADMDEDETFGYYGVALYPQYKVSDSFTIGARGEYFGYHYSGETGDFELPSVFAATLTGSYTVENLTIKPEIRLDSWSGDDLDGMGEDYLPYLDSDNALTNSLAAFTLAAIYSF